ncbi:unnamed protein product [Caenorhabditis angaria]|uniref:Uncharacterized protein n=1 Tax=Caenorhabditis angaria TaxID=860376 RepID=A0A9P1N9M6_9PELO|nr:unnamed protein product [Caenorhabditis angaria]
MVHALFPDTYICHDNLESCLKMCYTRNCNTTDCAIGECLFIDNCNDTSKNYACVVPNINMLIWGFAAICFAACLTLAIFTFWYFRKLHQVKIVKSTPMISRTDETTAITKF